MSQRAKRKARSTAPSPKSSQPKKKINLNGTSRIRATRQQPVTDTDDHHVENGEQSKHTAEDTSMNTTLSPPEESSPTSTLSKSTFSLPFFAFGSSSPSVNTKGSQPSLLSRIKKFLPDRSSKKMESKNSPAIERIAGKGKEKGKERAVEMYDENGNITAEESARMIELLDSPVSIQPWRLHQAIQGSEKGPSDSDGQSGHSVEDILREDGDEEERILIPNGAWSVSDHDVEHASSAKSVHFEEDCSQKGASKEKPGQEHEEQEQTEANDKLKEDPELEVPSEKDAEPESERAIVESKPSHASEAKTEVPKSDDEIVEVSPNNKGCNPTSKGGEEENESGRAPDGKSRIYPVLESRSRSPEREADDDNVTKSLNEKEEEEDLDERTVEILEVTDQNLSVQSDGEGGEKEEVDVGKGGKREENREEAPEDFNNNDRKTEGSIEQEEDEVEVVREDANGRSIDDSEDDDGDENVLIPGNRATLAQDGSSDVIDLTRSDSPEPNVDDADSVVPRPAPAPRLKSSGFFANGTLAREKRLSSQSEASNQGGSASFIIQQLGQRQVSGFSSQEKVLSKASTGFRKKDPIFSKARKSLAKGIASSKLDDILSSLKRHVKKTMQTPYIEGLLKKRLALAKVLNDDMPDDEIQIQYLRDILKRNESKYRSSLRPARRMLKEQERLAYEAKLLRKRAMGIMGRQPLPANLSPEQEEIVRQTFKRQGKIAQLVGAAVEARDISKMRDGQWLNDEVINFYSKLLLLRSDEAVKKRAAARDAKKRLGTGLYSNDEERRMSDILLVRDAKRTWNGVWNVWTFTSFFYEKLSTGGYSGVRQWTRKVDVFTKDIILLPINIRQQHWVCAAINMRKCRFEYYDSMMTRNPAVFTLLRNYLLAEYADKKKDSTEPLILKGWKNYFSRQSPQQMNFYDCGVFATMTMEQLSRRNPNDGELTDDLTVDKIVQRSKELAKQRGRPDEEDGESDSGEEEEEDERELDNEDEEEWNFSQSDIPYLRHRMVYEIASSKLLNE
ncbi:hypothetical protein CBS101457_003136 [Exobasidium rhododendri]|nr:hypothetical protein CBS101457_003136 [Exobasidium rhododendri]